MNNKKQLNVYMNNKEVSTLAETKDYMVAFEYSDKWIADGFSICPISLPLRKGVSVT